MSEKRVHGRIRAARKSAPLATTRSAPQTRRGWISLVAALTVFAAVNALAFATPLYRAVLDPASSTGSYERTIDAARILATDPARDVLVLGDSRIYVGLDARKAEVASGGLRFVNAAVPGTTPRAWEPLYRAIDPDATRFRAIVVPVDTYADDDSAIGSVDGNDRLNDLRYIALRTAPPEALRVAESFSTPSLRFEALCELLLRGPLLRDDVQAFAEDPRARLAALASGNQPRSFAVRGFGSASLAGLRVDFVRGVLTAPPGFPADGLAELERQVLHVPAPSASYAAYRRMWLEPLVRRYAARGTPVVFVRIPTRPLHRALPPPPSGTLEAFARQDGARLLPQMPYLALERPELFADADHLNAEGAVRFSALLGAHVARVLRDPSFATLPAIVQRRAPPSAAGQVRVPPPPPTRRIPSVAWLGRLAFIGVPMPFASYEFALFLSLVAALYYTLPSARARRGLLLVASWYFYARWNAWYLIVLLALTLTDYAFAIAIEAGTGARRRWLLAAGVGCNLLFLGTVKYAGFVTGSLAALLRLPANPWTLHLLVPVGISFHTFQSISYLVDVSRGKFRAVRNPFDYALYLAFFPQLLAGPIVRAERFFSELVKGRAAELDRMVDGLRQIVLGLIKKYAVADRFAPVADGYFSNIGAHPGAPAAWSAAFAFALQIYFDFSGYSDIAIGCARLLGFEFPQNFNRPYLAWSITEFWRRWHMTLSAWLRDYLYIPLGGNRHGRIATMRNLMLTMLLGGLWHGASWTFVAWGGYHGALLALERALGRNRGRGSSPPQPWRRAGATLGAFVLVLLGWALFRARSFGDAFGVVRAMAGGGAGPALLDAPLCALAVLALAVEIICELRLRLPRLATGTRAYALAGLALLLELGLPTGPPAPFIYFKF